MANFKGFGTHPIGQSPSKKLLFSGEQQRLRSDRPNLEAQIELWHAGLLSLQWPADHQPRSLTETEQQWLRQLAKTEYLTPDADGQRAIFYTAAPPDFSLSAADWYLRPDDYWQESPVLLSEMVKQFPVAWFCLNAAGQSPGFYPDPGPDYSLQQEQTLRQIFRETIRLGWSLPQYKWYVMQRFQKTTPQINLQESLQILEALSQFPEPED